MAVTTVLKKQQFFSFEVKTPEETVTADGTKAMMVKVEYRRPDNISGECLGLGLQKDGEWVLVTFQAAPPYAPYSTAEFSKIVKSLKFTK